MANYEALFEDEDDIFNGSPVSKYWDIQKQSIEDVQKDEFDSIVERLAVMESMLNKIHDEEQLDKIIKNYAFEHQSEIDTHKKSIYMELAGILVYRAGD